jgi:hypothetical protein
MVAVLAMIILKVQNSSLGDWSSLWVKPLPGLPGFPLDELLADQLPIARLGKNSGILVRDPRDRLWGLAVLARSALG